MVTHRKESGPTGSKPSAAEIADANLEAAALLYDMAALQPTERSRFGYKRAAKAIARLPVLVSDLVSESDLDRLKQYFIKVRTSTEPYAVY